MNQILPMHAAPKPQQQPQVTSLGEYQSLVESLSERVTQVHVCVRRWRGNVALKGAQVILDGQTMTAGEDDVSTPSKCVVPVAWRRRFDKLERQLRWVIERPPSVKVKSYSPYKRQDGSIAYHEVIVSDNHLLLSKEVPSRRQELEQIKVEEWDLAVEEFAQQYGQVIEDFAKKEPVIYGKVRHCLPADGESAKVFFEASFSERPLGYNADSLTVEALEKGAGPFLDAMRESLVRANATALQNACQDLVEKMQKGVNIQGGTLDKLRTAVSAFGSFGDLIDADGKIGPLLLKAEEVLEGLTATDVNSARKNGDQLAETIGKTLEAVTKSVEPSSLLSSMRGKQRKIAL